MLLPNGQTIAEYYASACQRYEADLHYATINAAGDIVNCRTATEALQRCRLNTFFVDAPRLWLLVRNHKWEQAFEPKAAKRKMTASGHVWMDNPFKMTSRSTGQTLWRKPIPIRD